MEKGSYRTMCCPAPCILSLAGPIKGCTICTDACMAFELGRWISQSSEGERATLQELLEY